MNTELTGPMGAALLRFAAFLLAAAIFGFAVSSRLKSGLFLGERVLLGVAIGLATATVMNFLAGLAFGFHVMVVILIMAVMLMTALLQLRKGEFGALLRRNLLNGRPTGAELTGLVVFLSAVTVFFFLATRLVVWQDGALATGYLDNWGDLPLHISLIMKFCAGSKITLQSTILAGEPLTYPFLSDFMSAILMKLGIPLEHAIEFPAILMNAITVTLLFFLGYRLVRHRGAAVLAPVLFILAGGLGFLWFFSDLIYAPKPVWEFLQHLPQRYTNLPNENIHWVNPTLAHLLPQRSFLFGFPLGLSVLLLWWSQTERQRPCNAWLSGMLTGVLPLFHTHTFLTLLMVAAIYGFTTFVSNQRRRRELLRYWQVWGVTAALLAAPQLIYLLHSSVSLGGIRFNLGWMADGENLLLFWLKNTGLFIPLVILALCLRKRLELRQRALRFYLPFGILFLLCNLFLFAPFPYDSNKVLVYWLLLSLPLVARILVLFFKSESWWLHGFLFRVVLLCLVLSGSLNLIHELQSGGWTELNAEEVALAKEVAALTNSDATFMTVPMHNNLLTLAGRGVVLGYPGHVLSHGLNPNIIEADITDVYNGDGFNEEILSKYHVNYIVAGPHERQRYGDKIDELSDRFPVLTGNTNATIYAVGPPALTSNQ